jgi:hypothetical protein
MDKQLRIVIMSVLATALLVGGGMYLLMSQLQNGEEKLLPQTVHKTWQSNYFSFDYPSNYIADEEGLWTDERYQYHLTAEACSGCHIPSIEVHTELIFENLDSYIAEDMDLGSGYVAKIEDVSAVKTLGLPVERMVLGENEVIKIRVGDMYDVHAYYAEKNGRVVSFKVYYQEDDTEELRDMIATLKFE